MMQKLVDGWLTGRSYATRFTGVKLVNYWLIAINIVVAYKPSYNTSPVGGKR